MRNSTVAELHQCLGYYQKYFIGTEEQVRHKTIEQNPPPEWMPENLSEIYMLFRLLAVCHTVVVDKDVKNGEIQYQASSPDELALT
jgi:magnesium-transporting ATPase (P-type)